MISLKRILHPTDFSQCSRKALTYACALAEQYGAELHLLHVVESPVIGVPEPGLAFVMPGNTLAELDEEAKGKLAALPGPKGSNGKTTVRAIRHGSPCHEIVRYARESGADLVVLGTQGRTGLAHILLGSVAEQVVRKSPCPVLAVHPDEREFVTQ